MTEVKVVYGVPWIEVEFGQRPEGWKLFLDKEECVKSTKEADAQGAYAGGYCGPERPSRMYEIPFDILDEDIRERFNEGATSFFTSNYWSPKFKDSGTLVDKPKTEAKAPRFRWSNRGWK